MAVTITATVLPDSRSVRVDINGLEGDPKTIWRTQGTTAAIAEARFAIIADTSSSFIGVDYEAGLDVPIVYSVQVGTTITYAAPVTIVSGDRDWYTALGQPSLSRVINVESFPALVKALARSEVRPLTSPNPLVVLHARLGVVGVLTLITLTYEEAQAVRALLELSPLFQFKCPPDRGVPFGSLYLLAGDYEEQRTVPDGAKEPSRRFVINVVEVDRPPLVVAPPYENTWQDWYDEALWNASFDAWTRKSWLDILIEPLPALPSGYPVQALGYLTLGGQAIAAAGGGGIGTPVTAAGSLTLSGSAVTSGEVDSATDPYDTLGVPYDAPSPGVGAVGYLTLDGSASVSTVAYTAAAGYTSATKYGA